jgi:hypothetical protein
MTISSASRPQYSIAGYRNKIRTTSRHVLLVEGSSDKAVFRRLLHEATVNRGGQLPEYGLDIDTAESLIGAESEPLGNRDKVEGVCEGIHDVEAFDHFVGFADREFREFDDLTLSDLLSGHRVHGRLVWSRGHSIENYFFDLDTFSDAVQAVALTDSYVAAVELYTQVFLDLLRMSAAVSLAGRDHGVQGLVAGSLKQAVIVLDGGTVSLDIASWVTELLRSTKGNQALVESITASYATWDESLIVAAPDFLRWLCHGRVGLNAMWTAYSRCVLEVSGDEREANSVLQAGDDVRLRVMTNAWARRSFIDQIEHPRVVLEMLGMVD